MEGGGGTRSNGGALRERDVAGEFALVVHFKH